MLVKELRALIANLPGEMSVYRKSGEGLASVQHTFRGNLIGFDQYLELLFFGEDEHTPNHEDIMIERNTGFKNRVELIDGYKALQKEIEELKGTTL